MQLKFSSTKYEELPEIITPMMMADWLGIGENKAREMFNQADFPKIKHLGVKQLAHKEAVKMYVMNLQENPIFMKEYAKLFIEGMKTNEKQPTRKFNIYERIRKIIYRFIEGTKTNEK